jgi:hypothetical protein
MQIVGTLPDRDRPLVFWYPGKGSERNVVSLDSVQSVYLWGYTRLPTAGFNPAGEARLDGLQARALDTARIVLLGHRQADRSDAPDRDAGIATRPVRSDDSRNGPSCSRWYTGTRGSPCASRLKECGVVPRTFVMACLVMLPLMLPSCSRVQGNKPIVNDRMTIDYAYRPATLDDAVGIAAAVIVGRAQFARTTYRAEADVVRTVYAFTIADIIRNHPNLAGKSKVDVYQLGGDIDEELHQARKSHRVFLYSLRDKTSCCSWPGTTT